MTEFFEDRRDSAYNSSCSLSAGFKDCITSNQGSVALGENLEAWLEVVDKSQTSQAWIEGRHINGTLTVSVSFEVRPPRGVVHTEVSVRPVLIEDGSRGRLVISVIRTPQSGPGAASIHVDFPEDGAPLPKNAHAVATLVITDKSMEDGVDEFDVFVQNFGGKSSTFQVTRQMLVSQLKDKVYTKFLYPSCQQRLLYEGKDMQDQHTLSYYGVREHSTINCLTRLRGG